MSGDSEPGQLACYVPRVLLRWLATAPQERVLTLEGTVVFVDLSGFTRLSERLSRQGREGAEHIVETINSCFRVLLADAYENGGSLLKFGGDALLLWFEGTDHPVRACASAVAMRRTLRRIGRIRAGGCEVVLRMSVGVHSGMYQTFLVGDSHREYLIAGPAATRAVEMEGAAGAGQILVSKATARLLPARCLGATCGPGVLLARAPDPPMWAQKATERPPDDDIGGCLSTAVRAHLRSAPAPPEHRTATVSFLQFGDLDQLIVQRGAPPAAEALNALVCLAQEAADRYEICFLNSDIAADGGKLLFSAGAPRALGDDEERMLLAMRHIVDAGTQLPIRIGVNRGSTFTGEVGPSYRRTYVVMGDVVNLAARLAAKARWGTVLTTRGVLARSRTRFAKTPVPPFMVKGKTRPIEAVEVENAVRAATAGAEGRRLPLVARDLELSLLRGTVDSAMAGRGAIVELIGEPGSGKSRLLAEAREFGKGMRSIGATCETYTQTIPYFAWRDPLRQLLGLSSETPDSLALERLRAHLDLVDPELVRWLPLLAIALGAQTPTTREVEELSPEFRTAKLHEVVLRFLAPALATPTLMHIEQAHLIDEASAALLNALSEHLASSSWLVIVTRRDAGTGFVASKEWVVRIQLTPLSRKDSLSLAEAAPEAESLPPDLIDEAVERSGGSPEFLLDLLAAAADGSGELPASLEAATSARLDVLPPGDRALVRRAAVLGLTFHPKRIDDVLPADAPRPDAATWLRLDSVFARDPDGRLRFTRSALREVAYETLPFRLRRELHAAVGEALERLPGHDIDADPAVLSLHFILAGDHQRAWNYAKAAAENAVAKFAQADAARLYRRAIEAGHQVGAGDRELAECWEALGEALKQSGHLPAAVDALSAARRLVRDDPRAQARLFLRHVRIAHRNGRLTAAVRWGGRGLRALGDGNDDGTRVIRAQLMAELAFIRYVQGRLNEAESLCRTVIGEFEAEVEQRPFAHASYVLDLVLMDLGRFEEAVHSARALAVFERCGDHEEQGHVLNTLGGLAQVRSDWDEALRLFGRAAEAYERAGCQTGIAIAACNIGEILADRGLDEKAAHQLSRARRIWTSNRERGSAAYAEVLLGRIAARGGNIDEARKLVGEATVDLRQLGETRYVEEAEAVLAEAEALSGDAVQAVKLATALSATNRELSAWLQRVHGVALGRLGQVDEANSKLQSSLAIARERGALYEVAATLDVLLMLNADASRLRAERDPILERLGIARLPGVAFDLSYTRSPPRAVAERGL